MLLQMAVLVLWNPDAILVRREHFARAVHHDCRNDDD
jgi:hypothetical protein